MDATTGASEAVSNPLDPGYSWWCVSDPHCHPHTRTGIPASGLIVDTAILDQRTGVVLAAVNAVRKDVAKMSDTMRQDFDAAAAEIVKDNAELKARLDAIATSIGHMTPGATLTQADIDLLKSAAAGADANVAAANAIPVATTTSTATAT